jgi:hypothetical protein
MTIAVLALVAIGSAGVAFAWPYIPAAAIPSGLSAKTRADWVNRLFGLASDAEVAGEHAVASASRSLIAALVAEREPAKKGR